jgi:acetyltransferase-like isoleucine patch superfamily enzyme
VVREIEDCTMTFHIGEDCEIHPTARIEVEEGSLGHRSIVREGVIIQGKHIVIGNEAYLDIRARIGGGSCFDPQSSLIAGDWLHMGVDSHINTAREVRIGHECGIGVGTKIFTHGAYESAVDGFPVSFARVYIGDRVWLPNAWVNPGVLIGDNTVVAAMSLVNRDLPDGCLAGGIPAKVLKEHEYPKKLSIDEIQLLLMGILQQAIKIGSNGCLPRTMIEKGIIMVISNGASTLFNTENHTIVGVVTPFTEILKNQLRRNGIRFRYYARKEGTYVEWSKTPTYL